MIDLKYIVNEINRLKKGEMLAAPYKDKVVIACRYYTYNQYALWIQTENLISYIEDFVIPMETHDFSIFLGKQHLWHDGSHAKTRYSTLEIKKFLLQDKLPYWFVEICIMDKLKQ